MVYIYRYDNISIYMYVHIYIYICVLYIYICIYIGYSSLPRGKPMLHPTLRSVLGSRKLRSQSQDLGDLDGSTVTDIKNPMYSWLVVSTLLKNMSQLGSLFSIYAKIKNVPNHQPDSIDTFYIYTHVIICVM